MNVKELQDLANIMRRDVLKMTTQARSGHPTSCMSCAEIMSVLLFHEMKYDIKNSKNPDNDEFVLSKGHAAPILYSALFHARAIKDNLMNLRKLGSKLEGHPMPTLKWVKAATGSLGQGLSIGVGMALAARLQRRKFRTYVLLGDSEVSEGEIYEALQLGSYYKLNNLIAIIDINRLGQRGQTMLGHNLRAYRKRFKDFGWQIYSINGHNIKQIISALKKAKKSKKPVMILAKTFKGRGVSFLEDKKNTHGKALRGEHLAKALHQIPEPKIPNIKIKRPTKSRLIKPRKLKPSLIKYFSDQQISTRKAYGDTLASLAQANSNLIAIDAEVSNSTKSEKVKKINPEQFIEAFIAEQNMIGMSQGLSIKGFNVFTSSFAAFLSRAYDQIRMAALSNSDLTICGSHCGVSIGKDGPSQMGLEDISFFRTLPNSTIFYPCDAISTQKLMLLTNKLKNIKYLRTTRPKTPVIYKQNSKFKIGDFNIIKSSTKDKVTVIGAGITVHEAIKAHKQLKKQKKNIAIIDLYCVKPFNAKKLINFVKKHGKKVIVVEDHYKQGGIGEMIAENLSSSGIKLRHLAVKEIPHSGTRDELLEKHKINDKAIISAVKRFK